jgi:hypothetical protein
LFREATLNTSPQTDEAVRDLLLGIHEKTTDKNSAVVRPRMRSITMKNPITKLAIAAMIIVAVVLGLFEFADTGGTSSVVWAEVARKVEASPGVSFRLRETGLKNPNKDWPRGYTVVRRFPTLSRTDWYRADRLSRTVFIDWQARTATWLSHDARVYSKKTLMNEDVRTDKDKWTDPQALLSLLLPRECRELGRKTIDGVLCEGVETTDSSGLDWNFPVESFSARLWVSVETVYPLLLEVEMIGGDDGSIRQTSTLDQFQWNLDFEESGIEPEIPSTYECID